MRVRSKDMLCLVISTTTSLTKTLIIMKSLCPVRRYRRQQQRLHSHAVLPIHELLAFLKTAGLINAYYGHTSRLSMKIWNSGTTCECTPNSSTQDWFVSWEMVAWWCDFVPTLIIVSCVTRVLSWWCGWLDKRGDGFNISNIIHEDFSRPNTLPRHTFFTKIISIIGISVLQMIWEAAKRRWMRLVEFVYFARTVTRTGTFSLSQIIKEKMFFD